MGPAILLIHGWSCDGNDWAWQLPTLSAHHRVIAVDLRGHGRSEQTESGYTLASFASDCSQLLDQLEIKQPVVAGHSLGSEIALRLAKTCPGLVRALIDVDGLFGTADEQREAVQGLVARVEGAADHKNIWALLRPGFYQASSPAALAAWHERRAGGVALEVLKPAMRDQMAGPESLLYRTQAKPVLEGLGLPVLSMRVDPAASQWLRSVLYHEQSKAISWEGSGHWLHQERPAEFNALLVDWLAALG